MKSFEEITPELDAKLNDFHAYAQEEKRLQKKSKPFRIGTFIAFFGMFAVGWIPVLGWAIAIVLFALVFILGFKAAAYSEKSKKLKNQYKTSFLNWYFKLILGEDTVYNVETKITAQQVKQLQLFPKFNTLKAEDYVKSKWDGLDFEMTELHLSQENDEDYTLKFSGIFMIVTFQKDMSGKTYVLPKQSRKLLFNRFPKEHQDTLENAQFHEYFDVYGAQREFTRYLLTPGMMERILKLSEEHRAKLYFLFNKNKLFMAIDWRKDLFEPDEDLSNPMNNFKILHEQLATVKSFVDTLRDQRQIWEG